MSTYVGQKRGNVPKLDLAFIWWVDAVDADDDADDDDIGGSGGDIIIIIDVVAVVLVDDAGWPSSDADGHVEPLLMTTDDGPMAEGTSAGAVQLMLVPLPLPLMMVFRSCWIELLCVDVYMG